MSLILSGTDGLSDVDGTAATPAIRGTDANTGIFFPAADTIAFAEGGAECARFDSSGNFGLGVTPSAWSLGKALEVGAVGNALWYAGSTTDLRLNCNVYYNSGYKYGANGYATYYSMANGAHTWYNAPSGTAGNAISFTQAMTLDASGNQLLGVTSNTNANNRLYVVGPLASYTSSATTLATSATSASVRLSFAQDSSQSIFMGMATDGTNYPSYIQAANGGGTTASNLTLQPFGGNLLVGGATATDYKLRVNGTSHFGDGYDNGVYGQVEITRPANQGTQFHLSFVRQGTQISGMGFLNNSSTFAIQNASTNAGSGVTLAVNGTSWGTTSDERTKDILGGVDNALQKLSNWRTVYFKYKTDAEAQTQRVGLIAQDVQATLPEAVSIEEDEIKTLQLRYTEVIPVLVKALQEQQALITQLTARITALESA